MCARGVFSFHSAPLPTCPEKSLSPIIPALARRARKSNHSRTYGIAGGGGCTGLFVRPIRRASEPFVSPTYQVSARNSLVSPTYAKTGGCIPTQKCRRADIFDFSPDISHFLPLTGPEHNRGKEERGAGPVETSGAQRTRLKDRRYSGELGWAAEASKAWPSASTWSGTRRSSRTRRNQERSFRP